MPTPLSPLVARMKASSIWALVSRFFSWSVFYCASIFVMKQSQLISGYELGLFAKPSKYAIWIIEKLACNSFLLSSTSSSFLMNNSGAKESLMSARNAIWISSSLSSRHLRHTFDLVTFCFAAGALKRSGNSGQQSQAFKSMTTSLQNTRYVFGQ